MRRQIPFLVEALTILGLIAAPFVLPHLGFTPTTINRILVWGLVGIGFDLLFGYTGLLSFGQSAFFGSGGMFAAYFEAHIEQGPVLEAQSLPIGIVTGALGQQWYDVTVTGMDAHAGPTPMALRHDALLAAARMVEAVNRIALSEAPHGRGTVGYLQVLPNSRNVIPGQVQFSVDFRNLSQDGLDRMDAALRAALARGVGWPAR